MATIKIDAPARVAALARRLGDGTWEPGRYRLIRVTEPMRKLIAAAPVRDRVVHHAVHRVLWPTRDGPGGPEVPEANRPGIEPRLSALNVHDDGHLNRQCRTARREPGFKPGR